MTNSFVLTFTAMLTLAPLFADEGDVLFFDELRDPAKSALNYVSYYHQGKKGPQPVLEKKVSFSKNGILVNGTRLFSRKADFKNCDVQFDFMLKNDKVVGTKHHGFIGFEIHASMLPLKPTQAEKEKDRSFRVYAQIGRKMPLHDIRTPGKSVHRTAGYKGLQMGKLPVMEAGRWYRMRLLCSGQTVTIFLDGNELGKVNRTSAADEFAPVGRFALWGYQGEAYFRNILINDLGDSK